MSLKLNSSVLFPLNRRSSEIQGIALGKSLRAWTCIYRSMPAGVAVREAGFQARSKDQEILEEGGGAGPSTLPRRDHE